MRKCFAITGPFVPTNEPMTLLSYKHLRNLDVFCDVMAQSYVLDKSLEKKLENDSKYSNFKVAYLGKYNDALFSIKNVNLLKALFNVNRYVKKCIEAYKKEKYDFIYTSSFPAYTIRAGKKIKGFSSIPWIASFTDPIHESPYKKDKRTFKEYSLIEKGAFLVYTHFYVNEKDEITAFEHADILVFICEEQRDFMVNKYCERYKCITKDELLNKSVLFPLNYIPEWKDIGPIEYKKENQTFTLAHFGRVYGLRDVTPFINAVAELVNEDEELKSKLKIKQFGEFRKSDIKLIKKLGLSKQFEVNSKIPYDECIIEMNKADALLIFDTILDDKETQPYLPSKILEYSLIGKNILTITSKKSPSYRISMESKSCCSLNNVSDIKMKLMSIIKGESSTLNYKYTNEDASLDLKHKIEEITVSFKI